MVCERGHSYDRARSGYVNLLQPQDRRSSIPGDSPGSVAARRRFIDRGFTEPFARSIATLLEPSATDTILDAGCGEGFYLGSLQDHSGAECHGTDLSTTAIDLAARRYGACSWTVANADRFVPYAEGSFTIVMSITARLNAAEFRRVVTGHGRLLVAVAAPEDLIELREAILGEAKAVDRRERTVAAFSAEFELISSAKVVHQIHLDPAAATDLMASTYRGARRSQRERMEALGEVDVTLGLDLLLFRPK